MTFRKMAPKAFQRIAASVLLLSSISAAHYIGFMRCLPESMQGAAASTLASGFIAVFWYYFAVSLIGARIGAYVFIALRFSGPNIYRLVIARKNASEQKVNSYLENATKTRLWVESLNIIILPFLLAVLYAELKMMAYIILAIFITLLLLVPVRLPDLALYPNAFEKRMAEVRLTPFHLDYGTEILLLAASALSIFAYFLGQARFERLMDAKPSAISTGHFEGPAIVLIRSSSKTMLLMQRIEGELDRRFVFIDEESLTIVTNPPKSKVFESVPINGTKKQAP